MESRYRHRVFLVLMRKKRGLATPLSRCLYPLFAVRGFRNNPVPVGLLKKYPYQETRCDSYL